MKELTGKKRKTSSTKKTPKTKQKLAPIKKKQKVANAPHSLSDAAIAVTNDRLKRAKIREENRRENDQDERYMPDLAASASQVMSTRQMVKDEDTPFGPVNLSNFPTKDPAPKVTTVKKKYGGAVVGHKYSELEEALAPTGTDERRVATELLAGIEGKPIKRKAIISDEQNNAAAKTIAITHGSEPLRVGGTGKEFRGWLRGVEAGEVSLADVMKSDNPGFAMAKNPKHQRRRVNYKETKYRVQPKYPKNWDKLARYMSQSSDDD